uniref:DUF7377 domain-containing protein n=1 Tax=Nelumbo nucifera TaxID=4432 RepID=A0A822XJY5_NELNU|nr:TPA_asm: hypothetical protein HUJ06_021775 [Nelumbo nucifera]
MKDVFLHIRMLEQAMVDDHLVIFIQEMSDGEVQGSIFKTTFACTSSISFLAMLGALDSVAICCKKTKSLRKRKPKPITMKLPFGLCGCQEENTKGREIEEIDIDKYRHSQGNGIENSNHKVQLQSPLLVISFIISIDEWRRKSCPAKKLRECEKGSAYEFEIRRDLLELISYENHGLCVVTKLMDGGYLPMTSFKRKKKLQTKAIIRITIGIAEGLKFMNNNGVVCIDLVGVWHWCWEYHTHCFLLFFVWNRCCHIGVF